jgi:histone acetyltransferase
MKTENELIETEGETGIGFSKRNLNVQKEEQSGEVSFKVVKNDDNHENLIYLTHLKNIISKQLPKMPKEYIVRLVFDRKHESMILIKEKKRVVGGVCYRPNYGEKFIEIAFLAISHTEQVKGYGTRLMNKLKDHCKLQGLEYFLTYADNNAIGYFKKQGFNSAIKTPIDTWKDLIKDYDGGTLMEAYVNPNINYSELSNNLQKQKEFLINSCMKYLKVKRLRKHADLENIIKKNKNEVKIFIIIIKKNYVLNTLYFILSLNH